MRPWIVLSVGGMESTGTIARTELAAAPMSPLQPCIGTTHDPVLNVAGSVAHIAVANSTSTNPHKRTLPMHCLFTGVSRGGHVEGFCIKCSPFSRLA